MPTLPHHSAGKSVFERRGRVIKFGGSMPWTTDPLGSADFTQSLLRLDRLCKRCPGDEDVATPAVAKLDGLTFESWVRRITRTSSARTLWAMIATLTLAAQPGELSFFFVLRHVRLIGVEALLASLFGGHERSCTGGSAELCLRMAAELGELGRRRGAGLHQQPADVGFHKNSPRPSGCPLHWFACRRRHQHRTGKHSARLEWRACSACSDVVLV